MKNPLLMIALASCSAMTAAAQETGPDDSARAKPTVKVTISKETTYITEPLRPDGYPDYAAAMNERGSREVTPENNAAVLLLKAYGPSEIPKKLRPEFFKLLGIEPLPEKGNYFVSPEEMVERRIAGQPEGEPEIDKDQLLGQFGDAQERPWTAEDFPIVAEWLAINKKPLELVNTASARTTYYVPLVADGTEPPMMALLTTLYSPNREFARAKAIQAMGKIGSGDFDGAWQDLLTVHRLARLFAKDRWMIGQLVAIAVDGMACSADAVFAHSAKLTPKEFRQKNLELSKLGPIDNMCEKFAEERIFSLDYICSITRCKPSDIPHFHLSGKSGRWLKWLKMIDPYADELIDWDIVLRGDNQLWDRIEHKMQESDLRKQYASLRQLEDELNARSKRLNHPANFFVDWFASGSLQATTSQWLSLLFNVDFSAFRACVGASIRGRLHFEMARISLALSAYRAEHGAYPEKLDLLVPKYLAKIPDDTFSENPAPLRYRREGDAYVLWSVFQNGVDDDGNGYGEGDGKGDDWAMRPVPKVAETPE